jgi:uncharacterized protein (TIGR03067 family)
MKTSILTLLFLMALLSPLPVNIGAAQDQKEIQGRWRLIHELNDGKEMPAEEASKTRLTFDAAGKWKVEFDGKVVGEGTFTLNTTTRPKTIDYAFTQGEDKGKTFTAIYKLDGDSYTHCGVLKGARPKSFESRPGSGQTLSVFRRE